MPYSEHAYPKLVASALGAASFVSINCTVLLYMFYPSMRLPRTNLHGKTAIVTGANSGIGYESARVLASMGARVVMACRNGPKGEEAMKKIVAETGNKLVELEILDCAQFKSIEEFVNRWEARELKQIDILINNAGGFTPTLQLTTDGFEQTYQTNHLSHVLLTLTLLNRGYMASDARIVSVSSILFLSSDVLNTFNADNTDIVSKYQGKIGTKMEPKDPGLFYERSKAAQAVWTIVLQRRLSQTERWKDVTVHACHPGIVKTAIWTRPDTAGAVTDRAHRFLIGLSQVVGIGCEEGAVMPVWLATAKEPTKPELRGMFWSRFKWLWVWPWCLEAERQNKLWDKWCNDAQVSLSV